MTSPLHIITCHVDYSHHDNSLVTNPGSIPDHKKYRQDCHTIAGNIFNALDSTNLPDIIAITGISGKIFRVLIKTLGSDYECQHVKNENKESIAIFLRNQTIRTYKLLNIANIPFDPRLAQQYLTACRTNDNFIIKLAHLHVSKNIPQDTKNSSPDVSTTMQNISDYLSGSSLQHRATGTIMPDKYLCIVDLTNDDGTFTEPIQNLYRQQFNSSAHNDDPTNMRKTIVTTNLDPAAFVHTIIPTDLAKRNTIPAATAPATAINPTPAPIPTPGSDFSLPQPISTTQKSVFQKLLQRISRQLRTIRNRVQFWLGKLSRKLHSLLCRCFLKRNNT